MYDDLARIERVYGCVAEYNRCMEEEYDRRCDGYEPSYEELCEDGEYGYEERNHNMLYHDEPEEEKRIFEVGDSYRTYGFYGGITDYIVKEIDRPNERILLAEVWFDVDGSGTRPAEWHNLVTENGNEKALEWTSKEFGDIWIYA